MSAQNIPRTFDTAYPCSMVERKDGYYIERNDHESMAAALVELIASRDRELEDLRGALDAIRQYGSDTLSGRADGGVDDRAWQLDAVLEMTRRARAATGSKEA